MTPWTCQIYSGRKESGGRQGDGELVFNRDRVSIWDDEKAEM